MTTANHRLKGTIRQTVFPEWSIRARPAPRVTAAPGLTAESVETAAQGCRVPPPLSDSGKKEGIATVPF